MADKRDYYEVLGVDKTADEKNGAAAGLISLPQFPDLLFAHAVADLRLPAHHAEARAGHVGHHEIKGVQKALGRPARVAGEGPDAL